MTHQSIPARAPGVMGVLALISEFENDIRRERQMDGIAKARDRGVRFGRKPLVVSETIQRVRKMRKAGKTGLAYPRRLCTELYLHAQCLATQSGLRFSLGLGLLCAISRHSATHHRRNN
jgi:DNA invertase Pin-like site-specific DNA recombinase